MNNAPATQRLHDEYAEKVNLAIAEGRDDLVQALVEEFTKAITSRDRAAARAHRFSAA